MEPLRELIKETALKGRDRARDKFELLETKARAGIDPGGESAYIETVIAKEIDKAREQSLFIRGWLVNYKPTGTRLLNLALKYCKEMKSRDFSDEVLKKELENAFGSIYRIEELEKIKGQSEINYNGLRLDMIENGFIQKADERLFNMALNYRVYPKDRERIVWKGDRREAALFAKRLSMDKSQFNKCFEFPDSGRPLHKTDFIGLLADKEYKIHEILKKHNK